MEKLRRWLDNYWYHYKWHTLICAFCFVVLIIAISSFITKEEYDVYAVYAGAHAFVEDEQKNLIDDIAGFCSDDYSGNGEIQASLLSFVYVSPERAKEYLENDIFYSAPLNYETRKSIVSQLNSGDAYIYLMDESLFCELVEIGYFLPLKDVLGQRPENAYNDYGILLGDTALGKNCESASVLPEDTVLCIKRNNAIMSTLGTAKNEENLAHHKAVFARLAGVSEG